MSQEISEAERTVVEHTRDALLEHFDSVRIFVTKHNGEKDTTSSFTLGGGNYYAQHGLVHEWLARMDSRAMDQEEGEEEEE